MTTETRDMMYYLLRRGIAGEIGLKTETQLDLLDRIHSGGRMPAQLPRPKPSPPAGSAGKRALLGDFSGNAVQEALLHIPSNTVMSLDEIRLYVRRYLGLTEEHLSFTRMRNRQPYPKFHDRVSQRLTYLKRSGQFKREGMERWQRL